MAHPACSRSCAAYPPVSTPIAPMPDARAAMASKGVSPMATAAECWCSESLFRTKRKRSGCGLPFLTSEPQTTTSQSSTHVQDAVIAIEFILLAGGGQGEPVTLACARCRRVDGHPRLPQRFQYIRRDSVCLVP